MTMRAQKGMAAGLAGVLAVALTGAVVVSPANAETASQPVVALLMQNPAPGDGGVAAATVALPDNPPRGINHVQGAGGWYDVVVEISPGDTVDGNTAASDRAMTLTFSAGVRVVRVEQRLVGKDPVDLPLPGADRTVTDVAKAVPITQAASWGATLEVTTMSTGVDLTTTATAGMTGAKGTIALAPVTVRTVAADARCGPVLCTTIRIQGDPGSDVAFTSVDAEIRWSPNPLEDSDWAGVPVIDAQKWGDGKVHVKDPLMESSGAPFVTDELDAYLQAWITSKGGGKLVGTASNTAPEDMFGVTAGPTLKPGFYRVDTMQRDRWYAVNAAGSLYASSAEFRVQSNRSEILVAGSRPPVVQPPPPDAPPPPVIKVPPKVAG